MQSKLCGNVAYHGVEVPLLVSMLFLLAIPGKAVKEPNCMPFLVFCVVDTQLQR